MLIRGVRDFLGLLIYASFFTGFRKHPVPGGGRGWGEVLPYMAYTGMCRWKGYIFFVFPVLTGYIIPRETVVNRVYNSARDW